MIKFYLSIKFFIFIFIPPSFSALRHKKAPPVGLEPTTLRLTAACSTDWAMEDHSLSLFSLHVPSKLHTRNILLPTALRSTVPGQTLDRLVTVSSMHYCTSTSALSTLSSSRGLTTFVGISHLEGGFTLRCLQRLSLPDLATLPCSWRNNRYTSGQSSPVLSY